VAEKLPEGRSYKPRLLLGYWSVADLFRRKPSRLLVYIEPQLVYVPFDDGTAPAFEFGVNAGLEFQKPVGARGFLTAAIGSGPHYITVETDLQHKGYIFSDNFEVGWRQSLGASPWRLALKCRFRHISNANLMKPNKGIDNWFVILGLTRALHART